MNTLINLTPHRISIIDPDTKEVAHVPPSGSVARVAMSRLRINDLAPGVAVFATSFGALEGLPPAEAGVVYLVSLVVAQAAAKQGRVDILSPGELVRGPDGQPVGCLGLSSPL